MAQIIQKISVDVSNPNFFKAIVAKQYDSNSRFLNATLTHNGEKIEVLPTSTVTINARRKYGGEKSFYGVVNDDGTVTVPLTYWMLELEGTVDCDISVIDAEDKKLSTTKFVLEVEKASCKGENIEVDDDCDVVVKLIEDVNELKEQMANVSATDQEYNPESENAQSGKALNPVLQEKIEEWQPNTEYKSGDKVLFVDWREAGYPFCYGKCHETHTSPSMSEVVSWVEDGSWSDRYVWRYWTAYFPRVPLANEAIYATYAHRDGLGNNIVGTYATKKEVQELTDSMVLMEGTVGTHILPLKRIAGANSVFIFGDDDEVNLIVIECYDNPNWVIGNTYRIVIEEDESEDHFLIVKSVEVVTPQVDNSYNPTSENAQSGKAVAQALNTKQDSLDFDFDETYVITEEEATATKWVRTVDLQGNPIRLTEMQVDFTIPAGENTGVQYLYFYYEQENGSAGSNTTAMRVTEFAYQHGTEIRHISVLCYKERETFYSLTGYGWTNNDLGTGTSFTGLQSSLGARMQFGYFKENPKPLCGLYFNVANGMPAAGTVVRIRGRRA